MAMYWTPVQWPCFCLATNKLFIHTTRDEATVGIQGKKGARLPCKERPAILTKPGALGVDPQYRCELLPCSNNMGSTCP